MSENIGKNTTPSRFYKRVGISFVSITVVLLFFVLYLTLSKATIIVEPKEETVNADLLIAVREENLKNGDVFGKVESVIISREANFPVSGEEGAKEPAKAIGEITIFNNHTANQTLVATTRFLSKEGVLFRLKDKVTVPAGGKIIAEVYADKAGAEGEVGPTTFIIPGLGASLQQKIYGESLESMTGGMTSVAALSKKDIEEASANMRASLLVEAKEKLELLLNSDKTFAGIVFKDFLRGQSTDKNIGEKTDRFKLKVEMEVVGVSYSETLRTHADGTIAGMVPSDRKLLSSNILELLPVIEKYDLEDNSATLKVALEGKTIISEESPVFDKGKFAGLHADEARAYLEKHPSIGSVEIRFFPFWLDRVPKFRDHIKIIVK